MTTENTHKPFIIAIDGTAASGKGTLSKRIANHFGYEHLDTGKLYRATAYAVLKSAGDCTSEKDALVAVESLKSEDFTNPELTSNTVGNGASKVAAIPAVRNALTEYQRQFPNGKTGVVVDGRDIGTVIFPNADIKFFVTADLTVRAERRHKELQATGIDFETIYADLEKRDIADKTRKTSPLVAADDAHLVDTSKTDIETMVATALSHFA